MKRILSLLTAAVVASCTFGSPAAAWGNLEEMNKVINHTNFIVGNGCSGTLISKTDRLIVTAYHCVDNEIRTLTREEIDKDGKVIKIAYEKRERVTVTQKNYADFEQVGAISYTTNILDYDKAHDLAILQLVGKDLRSDVAAPVLHKGQKLQRGERVVAVGNPRMLDASVTTGVISSLNRTFDSLVDRSTRVPMLQFDANIQPGSSGGALFNDKGQYIGTTTAHIPGSDLSLAVPVFTLYNLLEKNCFGELFDPEANDAECREDPIATPE